MINIYLMGYYDNLMQSFARVSVSFVFMFLRLVSVRTKKGGNTREC